MPLWTALFVLLAPTSYADAPDVLDLGRRSMRAMEENRTKARQYAYREYRVTVDHDKNGNETERKTETWDIIGLEGSTYRKLVMRNDKELSVKEQKKEDERLEKERRLRQEENSGKRPRRLFSLSYSFFLPYDKLTDIYDLKLTGEEEVDGRRTFVVVASPKPGFQAKTDNEKESLNYHLKLWLVGTSAFPVRIAAEVTGENSRMQQGSQLRLDYLWLEDAWLPRELTFQYSARFIKMFTAKGVATQTYSDHHKFQVESTVQFSEKQ